MVQENTDIIEETLFESEISDIEIDENQQTRFKDGEELTFIRVRFPGNAKSFPFLLGSHPFKYGQKVLAQSDRGLAVGYINSFPYKKNYNKDLLPLLTIARIATEEDVKQQIENIHKEKKAEVDCQELIEKYQLDMTLTHVEFMQNGKKVVFYFNAPARVDFRELVKDLVGILKMRVELRQISVRDRTAAIGAIGACGLQTCCSSFLQNYGHVNIKMPKNQNLSIAQNRINGVCGQIKCCMKYEDEVYTHKRKLLPKESSYVKLLNGDIGKVLKHNLIKEQFDMLTDKGVIKRYTSSIYSANHSTPPQDWNFPTEFNLITNETNEIVKWTPKPFTNPAQLASRENSSEQTNKINEDESQSTENNSTDNSETKPNHQNKRRRNRNRKRSN